MGDLILGVDPGKLGALALITLTGELRGVVDMPTAGGEVSPVLLAQHLRETPGTITVAAVEEVAAFPRNGSIGNFKLGAAHGKVLGVLAALGVPVLRPRPTVWKKAMGLTAEKDGSRALALDTWPAWVDTFKRKKDDGRAEAALLALWALRHGGRP